MNTPTVIEDVRRLEPVGHDTFIDDLAPRAVVIAWRPRSGRPIGSVDPARDDRSAPASTLPPAALARAA